MDDYVTLLLGSVDACIASSSHVFIPVALFWHTYVETYSTSRPWSSQWPCKVLQMSKNRTRDHINGKSTRLSNATYRALPKQCRILCARLFRQHCHIRSAELLHVVHFEDEDVNLVLA